MFLLCLKQNVTSQNKIGRRIGIAQSASTLGDLLASLRLSVMFLTLLSWTMRGNSSAPALSQQSLPRLGWDICGDTQLANSDDELIPIRGKVCMLSLKLLDTHCV